jgi:hypothetical protein
MKGKQPLFIFALKHNKKYGSTKNAEAKRSKKKNAKAKRKSGNIYAIFFA